MNYTSSSNDSLAGKIKVFVETNLTPEISQETVDEWVVYCPFHTNTNTPSFYINKHTGLWHCFNPACGKKGSFTRLVFLITGKKESFVKRVNDDELLMQLMETEQEQEIYTDWDAAMERVGVDYSSLEDVEKLRYLLDRGFNSAILKHFEVGWSTNQQRVVIPIRDENYKIVGFIGRAVDEERKPKYKYSDNMPRKGTLFNLQNAKSYPSVIVTEGSLDAIKVHQAGFPNVVSCLGANISNDHTDLLNKYFNEIIIFSDNDPAGESMKDAIMERCPRKDLWVAQYPDGENPRTGNPWKDPGELSEEQIRQTVSTKISYLDYIFNEGEK